MRIPRHSLTKVRDCRAVAEIQRGVVRGGNRNAISRIFHSKNDQAEIAAWRLDLNRILHIFNVRSITFARPRLTVHF